MFGRSGPNQAPACLAAGLTRPGSASEALNSRNIRVKSKGVDVVGDEAENDDPDPEANTLSGNRFQSMPTAGVRGGAPSLRATPEM